MKGERIMSLEEIGVKIFAGSSSLSFAEKMCKYLGTEIGQSQTINFSEGNTFVKILKRLEIRTSILFRLLVCVRMTILWNLYFGLMRLKDQALVR